MNEATDATTIEAAPKKTFLVPVVKARDVLEVDPEDLPIEVYEEAFALGLKALLNRGQTEIKTAGKSGQALANAKNEAMAKAKETLAKMKTGDVRMSGGRSRPKAGVSGAVMTEARRLAKISVKDEIKAKGGKVSHYTGAEITKFANLLLDQDESYLAQAKENLEARTLTKGKKKVDISGIKASEKLVKAAEDKAAKAKEAAVARKAAGTAGPKVPPRARPAASQARH